MEPEPRESVQYSSTATTLTVMTQPTSWQQLWDQAQSTLSNAERSLASTSSPVTSRVLRVGQLDAELLDIELVNLLRDPLSKALGLVSVRPPRLTVPSWLCRTEASDECGFRVQSTLKSRFEPELSLFIQLTLYRLSVWATGASYGAKLQDLKYTCNASSASNARVLCTCNYFCHGALIALRFTASLLPSKAPTTLPRKILLAHGALTMVLPYMHTRLRRHALSKAWPDAPSSDRRRKAWELMTKLETTHAAIALASFVVFLWDGQ